MPAAISANGQLTEAPPFDCRQTLYRLFGRASFQILEPRQINDLRHYCPVK